MTADLVDGSAPRYVLLGSLRARFGVRELELGPAKQRAVLAVLLLNANRPVATTQIVNAVWGTEPPANGANVVQKYIAGLRRVLEPARSPRAPGELLTRTDAGYQLQVTPGSLDTDEFEAWLARARAARAEGELGDAADALGSALALSRSMPLAGLTGAYFDASREHLIDRRGAAQESWAEVELERGYHGLVATELGRLVGEFPLRERLRALLMLALYRCGRQAEALAVYRDARAFLSEEFGVEPGEQLQEMQQRILRSDPSLSLTDAADVSSMARAASPADGSAGARIAALGGAAPTVTRAEEQAAVQPPPAASPAAEPSWAPTAQTYAAGPSASPPWLTLSGSPLLPAMLRAGLPTPRRLWIEIGLAIVITVASVGFLTWMVLAYFAIRRRSRVQLVAVIPYLIAVVVALASTDAGGDAAFGVALFVIAVLGPINVIGSCIVYLAKATDQAERRALGEFEADLRRSLARDLLEQQSPLAHGLNIGRPDLPRRFDDGGLIDINSVPAQVLAGLPGVGPERAARIVDDRSTGGAFATVDDLVQRKLLPAEVIRRHDAYLIASRPA